MYAGFKKNVKIIFNLIMIKIKKNENTTVLRKPFLDNGAIINIADSGISFDDVDAEAVVTPSFF